MDRRNQLEQELSHLAVCAPHLYALTLIRGLQRDADEKTRAVLLDRLLSVADDGATEELRLVRRRARDYAAAGNADRARTLGGLGDLVPTLGQAALRHREPAHLRQRATEEEEVRQPPPPPPSEDIVLQGERIAIADLPRLGQGAAPAEREALVDRLGDLEPKRLLVLRLAAELRIASLTATSHDAAEIREIDDLKRGVALASRAIEARGIEMPPRFPAAISGGRGGSERGQATRERKR